MNPPRLRAFLLLLLPWVLTTLGLNALFGGDMVRQLRMLGAPSVPGTLLSSRVVELPPPSEPRYAFEVRYRYTVDGRTYEGDRYRFTPRDAVHRAAMETLAARFPAGATVPVTYLPEAPGDAVLLRGLEGVDLDRLLFAGAFTLLGLLAVYGLVYAARGPKALVAAFVVNGRTHVTLNALSPAVIGWSAMATLGLALSTLLELTTDSFPPLGLAALVWAVVLASGVLATAWAQRRMDSGELDLIFDERAQRLSLPPMRNHKGVFERAERLELDWTRVQAVTLERCTRVDKDGETSTLHRPTVTFLDAQGGVQREPILEWHLENRASALVGWLQSRLGKSAA